MKIADRTPFRNDSGQVDIWGRIQGTLRFGLGWSARLQAQETVIGVLDKVLGSNFFLLRNITLPDTDIDLPLVLVGPPGVYLINITPERGVYRARDDEWGTIVGDKFIPAAINQVQRTVKLGRVLQIYLDRAGYKGKVVVDPILMASDPGMHIESVRPAARIVMSDALERFAISMNQAHALFNLPMVADIARTIVTGSSAQTQAPRSAPVVPAATLAPERGNETASQTAEPENTPVFTTDAFGFSFEENPQESMPGRSEPEQKPVTGRESDPSQHTSAFVDFDDSLDSLQEAGSQFFEMDETNSAESSSNDLAPDQETLSDDGADNPETQPGHDDQTNVPAKKKKSIFGLTNGQILILLGIFIFWLCAIIGFAIYIYLNLNV